MYYIHLAELCGRQSELVVAPYAIGSGGGCGPQTIGAGRVKQLAGARDARQQGAVRGKGPY